METIEGRRAVFEALCAEHPIDKIFILETAQGLTEIITKAKEQNIVVIQCNKERLAKETKSTNHQGVVARVAAFAYSSVEDIFSLAKERNEEPLIVVLDGVCDEQNLGAIIRSCEVCGAHGVVIPKRRAASLTPNTMRASAGAAEHIPIARVPGIPSFLRDIKKQGVWVYGADLRGENVFATNFSGACALVFGSEHSGISHLTRELCDVVCTLPMKGKTGSLNVSCAATVMLYRVATTKNLISH